MTAPTANTSPLSHYNRCLSIAYPNLDDACNTAYTHLQVICEYLMGPCDAKSLAAPIRVLRHFLPTSSHPCLDFLDKAYQLETEANDYNPGGEPDWSALLDAQMCENAARAQLSSLVDAVLAEISRRYYQLD